MPGEQGARLSTGREGVIHKILGTPSLTRSSEGAFSPTIRLEN